MKQGRTWKIDFHGQKDGGLLRTLLGRLKMHRAGVFLCDKSEEQPGAEIEIASRLANEALKSHDLMIIPPIPVELLSTGLKLAKMSQALAYRAIRGLEVIPTRPRTESMIRKISRHVK